MPPTPQLNKQQETLPTAHDVAIADQQAAGGPTVMSTFLQATTKFDARKALGLGTISTYNVGDFVGIADRGKVLISSADTVPGFLKTKLVLSADSQLTLTEIPTGGNSVLQLGQVAQFLTVPQRGASNGVASLDQYVLVPAVQTRGLMTYVVASRFARLNLNSTLAALPVPTALHTGDFVVEQNRNPLPRNQAANSAVFAYRIWRVLDETNVGSDVGWIELPNGRAPGASAKSDNASLTAAMGGRPQVGDIVQIQAGGTFICVDATVGAVVWSELVSRVSTWYVAGSVQFFGSSFYSRVLPSSSLPTSQYIIGAWVNVSVDATINVPMCIMSIDNGATTKSRALAMYITRQSGGLLRLDVVHEDGSPSVSAGFGILPTGCTVGVNIFIGATYQGGALTLLGAPEGEVSPTTVGGLVFLGQSNPTYLLPNVVMSVGASVQTANLSPSPGAQGYGPSGVDFFTGQIYSLFIGGAPAYAGGASPADVISHAVADGPHILVEDTPLIVKLRAGPGGHTDCAFEFISDTLNNVVGGLPDAESHIVAINSLEAPISGVGAPNFLGSAVMWNSVRWVTTSPSAAWATSWVAQGSNNGGAGTLPINVIVSGAGVGHGQLFQWNDQSYSGGTVSTSWQTTLPVGDGNARQPMVWWDQSSGNGRWGPGYLSLDAISRGNTSDNGIAPFAYGEATPLIYERGQWRPAVRYVHTEALISGGPVWTNFGSRVTFYTFPAVPAASAFYFSWGDYYDTSGNFGASGTVFLVLNGVTIHTWPISKNRNDGGGFVGPLNLSPTDVLRLDGQQGGDPNDRHTPFFSNVVFSDHVDATISRYSTGF